MGSEVGGYIIEGQIGKGSIGTVYKAYHRNLEKHVVLKKMNGRNQSSQSMRREADILKNLRHASLPQVYDFLNINGDIYTVIDFIPGNSFQEVMERNGHFQQDDVLEWAKEICDTLIYLHKQRPPIIHSDIKPANIILRPDQTICLIDFNVSIGANGESAVTGYTKAYAPPEQIWVAQYNRNQPDPEKWMSIDCRADIYSLGACLYYFLSGKKPAQGADGKIPHISMLVPRLREDFGMVIMKCLEEDPSRRYQSARELYDALEEVGKSHRLIYAAVILGTVAALSLAGIGAYQFAVGRNNKYNRLVNAQEENIRESDYEEAERNYQDAVRLYPRRLNAYYNEAIALRYQGKLNESVDFIRNILKDASVKMSDEDRAALCYLLGLAYDGLAEYENAADAYHASIQKDSGNSDYYREYAIALVNTGDLDGARTALKTAEDNGMDTDNLNFLKGQIEYRLGNTDRAKDIFKTCLAETESNDMKSRCYLMISDCIESQDGKQSGYIPSYSEEVEILEQARKSLPAEHRTEIMQRLANAYYLWGTVNAGEDEQNNRLEKAIKVYEQMRDENSASYGDLLKLSNLYTRLGEYSEAEALLKELLVEYGERYETYRDLGYTEGLRQDHRVLEERDYTDFCDYYEHARRNYEVQGNKTFDDRLESMKIKYENIKRQ